MPNVSCPTDQDLQQLLLGQIPDAEAEPLEEHLEQCDRCLQAASTLKAEDTLAEAVRCQAAVVELSTGDIVEGLMQRLEKLRPAMAPAPQSTAGTIPGDATPPAAPAGTATEVLYDFLAAPQGPGELGRLGQYRILRVLGAGGMGVVFEAEDPHLGRLVALKTMLPSLASNPSARQRFLREAKAVAAIDHDHIVTIHQVGEEDGVPFLAMSLLKGESLENRLQRETKLPVPQVLQIGREIADGLAAAHAQGLVHRDIKPANLWLEAKENGTMKVATASVSDSTFKRVKILDFGLARAAGDTTPLTQSGAIVGSPAYMAPEQTRAGGVVDQRVDLFSLGCVLYRAATGELPFKGTDTMSILAALALDTPLAPRELNPQIPVALSDLIMELLAKKPADRPASAQAVVARIQAMEQASRERKRPEVLAPSRPRRRRWLPIAAAVFVGALALAAFQFGPAVYRFATNHGQLVIKTNDHDVEIIVKQGGDEIKILDTKTNKEVTLKAGTYQLELAHGKESLKLATNHFTLERGGRAIVEVTHEPRPPEERKASLPVQTQTIRKFAPPDQLLTGGGVTVDGKSWRITGNIEGTPRHVRLFNVPVDNLEQCMVLYGASMKSANLTGRAYLEMWCRFPGEGEYFSKGFDQPVEGTTDWSSYQIPFFLKKGQRPDQVKLRVVIEGKGTVWIKDVQLLQAPLPVTEEPDQPADPKARTIRKFGPKDKPLTQDGVQADQKGWRIDTQGQRTVRLFEIPNPGVEQCMVIYRASMKSTDLKGKAYLEMLCRFPGIGEAFSKGLGHQAEGTTEWASYETPFFLKKGERPDLIKVNVVIKGKGTVWIKDVQLLQAPLPPMDLPDQPAAAPPPDEIRTFKGHPAVVTGAKPRNYEDFPARLETYGKSHEVIGVRFDVDEKTFLRLQQFQEVELRVSIPAADEKDFPHKAMLKSIADKVNPSTGTVAFYGVFPNPQERFLPGMFARVRVTFVAPKE